MEIFKEELADLVFLMIFQELVQLTLEAVAALDIMLEEALVLEVVALVA
jgi:hypothetical protein